MSRTLYPIEVAGLTKSYADTVVLDHVDLRVDAGTVFALLGPNGAGKTTLVRILATLTRPDAGTARVAGRDVVRDRAAVRRQISLTGQYAAVDNVQTGVENLRMMARLHGLRGRSATARVTELLAEFELTEAAGRRVATWSGGLRRRLDLAVSLVGRPSVLFLDEPTTGLDLASRQGMWRLVTRLAAGGMTILLTTQYLEEADRLAGRIAVLDRGRVVAEGSAAQLKARVAERRLVVTVVDEAAYRRMVHHLGDRCLSSDPPQRTVTVATDGSAADVRSLVDELDPDRTGIEHFALYTASLDDVFLALTGGTLQKETAGV
jgi:ABC-2 type transport system ATP-binding protein